MHGNMAQSYCSVFDPRLSDSKISGAQRLLGDDGETQWTECGCMRMCERSAMGVGVDHRTTTTPWEQQQQQQVNVHHVQMSTHDL